MSTSPLQTVLSRVGSQARLAELLGTKQSTVSYWAKSGLMPAEQAVELERVTNGEIPRWIARPDLWDAEASSKDTGAAQ